MTRISEHPRFIADARRDEYARDFGLEMPGATLDDLVQFDSGRGFYAFSDLPRDNEPPQSSRLFVSLTSTINARVLSERARSHSYMWASPTPRLQQWRRRVGDKWVYGGSIEIIPWHGPRWQGRGVCAVFFTDPNFIGNALLTLLNTEDVERWLEAVPPLDLESYLHRRRTEPSWR